MMNSNIFPSENNHSSNSQEPSSSYRVRVWFAVLGLLLFVVLYVGIASWFTYAAYRMIQGVMIGGEGAVISFLVALPATFLAIFMWKALLFVRPGSNSPGVEITADDQPELFDFIYDLADEIQAPRPHRVFLQPIVNASVFYDLSILNFFLPMKKNLAIGLGLVNALNMSEFKAILAHEFGHFSQKSMAVGRWVYVGEVIARHIITKRDFLDSTLNFISSIDIRIAWIGWIMRTIVWSIRSLMESVFNWVLSAERALSHEMEFHADMVSVLATGSDALINSLYKLQTADADWEIGLDFANDELNEGKQVSDMFLVQTLTGEHMRNVMNDPERGQIPEWKGGDVSANRLFTEQTAQPPQMWSSHPSNTDREENAKREYRPAKIDHTSAWKLFRNPQELRDSVTGLLFEHIELKEKPKLMTPEEIRIGLDEKFSHESYQSRYQGAYLGRYVTTAHSSVDHLYGTPTARENVENQLRELYPKSLHEQVKNWKNLEQEVALLEAIEESHRSSPEESFRHRGKVVEPTELPDLISQVKQERDQALEELEKHDTKCRTLYREAAKYVGHNWKAYHDSLVRLLYYTEHSQAELNDASKHLANITFVSTASGRVSSGKLKKIINSANDLQGVMATLHEQAKDVELPEVVLKELKTESWEKILDKFELPPADEGNIAEWMKVIDGWVGSYVNCFNTLRMAVLAELLKTEKHVEECFLEEKAVEFAPSPAKVPEEHATRPRGSEREIQKKLDWWSRFKLADGTGYSAMRLAVAFSIVATVLVAGYLVGNVNLTIYNGLSIPVSVTVNKKNVLLNAYQHKSISLPTKNQTEIITKTHDGQTVEDFKEEMDKAYAQYVYNVAGAALLVEWTAVYGKAKPIEPVDLGSPRWITTNARHLFTEPPRQVKTSSSGTTIKVLSAQASDYPAAILYLIKDQAQKEHTIRAHAKWDKPDSKHLVLWLAYAADFPDIDEIIQFRLMNNPKDVVTLRFEQDFSKGDQKENVLKRHRELASQNPEDPDMQYIGIRTQSYGPEKDQAYLKASQKWPDNPWLTFASGAVHAEHAEWQKSLDNYQKLVKQNGPQYETTVSQIARIRRFLAGNSPPDLKDLTQSFSLQQLLLLETGKGLKGNPAYAYSLLNQNKIEEAWKYSMGKEKDSNLIILLAASKGAKKDWQEEALNIPVQEIKNKTLLYYLAALAYRNQKPYEHYLEEIKKELPTNTLNELSYFERFVEQGAPDPSLENQLDGLDPFSRGMVLAMTMVMFPEKADEKWKPMVRAFMFASERPSL